MNELDAPRVVHATLNYTAASTARPRIYMGPPPPGSPQMTGIHPVSGIPIRDGRAASSDFSLDQQGFVLRSHLSQVQDFYDDAEVRRVYYPEVEALIRAETGAEAVVIFDHTRRAARAEEQGRGGVAPGRPVHNDHPGQSAARRVRDHVGGAEAEARLRNRFSEINVWRPIRGPLQDAPLALCDARTVAAEDFIAGDLIYPDKVGEHYRFVYNPAHRWFYFPDMQPDEAILLKCFDSDAEVPARFTPHSAFDDPGAPADRPPRESIEVRALVFFAPDS